MQHNSMIAHHNIRTLPCNIVYNVNIMYNYTLSTWTPYSMYTLYILYYIYSFFHGVNAGFQHQSIHFLLGPITDRRHFQNRLNRITTGNTTLNGAQPRICSPTHVLRLQLLRHHFVRKLLDCPLPPSLPPRCGFVTHFALVLLSQTGV